MNTTSSSGNISTRVNSIQTQRGILKQPRLTWVLSKVNMAKEFKNGKLRIKVRELFCYANWFVYAKSQFQNSATLKYQMIKLINKARSAGTIKHYRLPLTHTYNLFHFATENARCKTHPITVHVLFWRFNVNTNCIDKREHRQNYGESGSWDHMWSIKFKDFCNKLESNGYGAVHILRNHFLSVSRHPPPFRNQIRHWIEQKLH